MKAMLEGSICFSFFKIHFYDLGYTILTYGCEFVCLIHCYSGECFAGKWKVLGCNFVDSGSLL